MRKNSIRIQLLTLALVLTTGVVFAVGDEVGNRGESRAEHRWRYEFQRQTRAIRARNNYLNAALAGLKSVDRFNRMKSAVAFSAPGYHNLSMLRQVLALAANFDAENISGEYSVRQAALDALVFSGASSVLFELSNDTTLSELEREIAKSALDTVFRRTKKTIEIDKKKWEEISPAERIWIDSRLLK